MDEGLPHVRALPQQCGQGGCGGTDVTNLDENRAAVMAQAATLTPGQAMLDPKSILSSVGEAVYSGDIESDRMTWSQNAAEVLGINDMAQIASGSGYAVVTDSASPVSLQATIFECQRQDKGTGVAYSARYLFNPTPGRRIWVEDKGRWFANAQGRPWLAHGVVRIVSAANEAESTIATTRQIDPATGALTRPDFCNLLGETLEKVKKDKRHLVLLIFGIEELAHHNRKTILREIEQRLEAMKA